MRSKFADFVHSYDGENGVRWVVAELGDDGRYTWPVRHPQPGGIHSGWCGMPIYCEWQFKTRKAALACARRLYTFQIEAAQ